jgi:hypothetical protein
MTAVPVIPATALATPSDTPLPPGLISTSADAARYCILRRLAPALKHDLVINLQGVSILAEIISARLDKGGGQADGLQPDVDKMNRLARAAIGACLVVAGWMDTPDDEGIDLHQGILESVRLLENSLGFAGFAIRNDTPQTDLKVSRVVVRNLVSACLIILADSAETACELVVQTQVQPTNAIVRISRGKSTADTGLPGFELSARRVQWSDVQSLAQVEGVEIVRDDTSIELRLPRMQVTTALKIVPL